MYSACMLQRCCSDGMIITGTSDAQNRSFISKKIYLWNGSLTIHWLAYQCHHGMGISGNRSSTTNIFSSDSFGISVIYTFWAIHPCKNNHLPISFRAVIVNSNLSNLFLTITALEMLVKWGFLHRWTPEEMGNTNMPISSLDKEIGSTASVARSSMVKMKINA